MDGINIIGGESTPIKKIMIEGYSTLDSNWQGLSVLKKELGKAETDIVNRVCPKDPTNSMFLGYLTPDETEPLDPGIYYLTHEIWNDSLTPPFKKEFQFELKVDPQGA